MKEIPRRSHRDILMDIAVRAMREKELMPEFSAMALAELQSFAEPGPVDVDLTDLRDTLWCSIDNDDSKDLDQLTFAETLDDGSFRVLVAIADVDALIKRGTAIDNHAKTNTSTVYTYAGIFPMLPLKICCDLTSLVPDKDRTAVIVEMMLTNEGSLRTYHLYRAAVRNHAQLTYDGVAAWLEGAVPVPCEIEEVEGLESNIRLQDDIAGKLRALRHLHGALDLETIQSHPIFDDDTLENLEEEKPNRAKRLIEDLMIAANGVTAVYLDGKNRTSLRRMVRTPKHWDRIVELAAEKGSALPRVPDPAALETFLLSEKKAHPVTFPDLSLSVVKLLGSGEYMVRAPGSPGEGHFGLAVRDYTHSTAPNRRYPDLITQRLLKAAIAGAAPAYTDPELEALALHCTETEDVVKKVERMVEKSAAAILLESRIGEQFDAIVTGASVKGTWVRLFNPPVEGKLERGFEGMKVGQRLRVRLLSTNVDRGFIDFTRVDCRMK